MLGAILSPIFGTLETEYLLWVYYSTTAWSSATTDHVLRGISTYVWRTTTKGQVNVKTDPTAGFVAR